MAKKLGKSDPSGSRNKPPRQSTPHRAKSKNQKQDCIILPAIKATERKNNKTGSSKNSGKAQHALISTPPNSPTANSLSRDRRRGATQANSVKSERQSAEPQLRAQSNDTPSEAADFLPEYRSQTNGLREFLSTIDPPEQGFNNQGTSFLSYPTETAMHIPHSRPGIPVSPDLPIGPTRWGLYFSGTISTLALLLVSALAFSHFTSPTGIDWVKAQEKAGQTYSWIVAGLSPKPSSDSATDYDPLAPLKGMVGLNETQVATASRISTTAASAKPGRLKTPDASEIFISPQELESQIKAFEQRLDLFNKNKLAARKSGNKPSRTTLKPKQKLTPKAHSFDQLMVIPAANIDPDMESQIFKRASSYLKQRDISSARMILQYAATLGSGISAMALAETFDPNYLKGVNLHGVTGNRSDARKWYNMAALLGIKEASARLTDLK